MRKLFLDDIRFPGDITWVDINANDKTNTPWQVVRSFDEAKEWVLVHGCPDIISFDHDLGYAGEELTQSGIFLVTNAEEEKTGYDFAKWLIEQDLDNGIIPANFSFVVHSKNPTGARNISECIERYLKYKTTGL